MSEKLNFTRSLIAINRNEQIKKLQTFGDRLADRITSVAGSTSFLLANVGWFLVWILVNSGAIGHDKIFDAYPFGFLTMVVSLEAIILSVFVLISQNRQSKKNELQAELDYLTDLQADAEIATIISILERLAVKQDINITDLLDDLALAEKKIVLAHPITEKDLTEPK